MEMMKRAGFVGLVWVGIVCAGVALAQPNIRLGSAISAPGETAIIPVTFTNTSGDGTVVGLQFDVQFNSTQFTIGSLTNGSALSPHLRHSSTPSVGTLRVLIRPEVTPTLPNINSGVIVNLPFTIGSGATPGPYDLTFAGVVFSDKSANAISGGTANGQLTVGAPDISVSTMALNFGGAKVGIPSAPKSITVSNAGTATATLTISQIEITGANASDFNQTNDCSSIMAPGGSCTVNVTVIPSSTGPKTGTLGITSNDPDETPLNIALSGNGGTPQILVRRVILGEDFTTGVPGTWTNQDAWGPGCGRVIGPPFADPWAIVDPNCGAVSDELLLTPYFNASACTEVALLFSNQFSQVTTTTATVSVTDDYGKTWMEVETMTDDEGPAWREMGLDALPGAEAAQVEFAYLTSGGFWAIDNVWVLCEPPGLSFKALASKPSPPQTLAVTNKGTANLSISTVALSGPEASHFQISGDWCGGTSIEPGGSCGVEVTFMPDTTGPDLKNVNLSISSDDAGSPTLVALSGKRVDLLASPESGTLGSEITVRGLEFGLKKGKVLIGGAALKILNWGQEEIKGLLSKVVTTGPSEVVIQRKDPKGAGPISEAGAFAVEKPKIWRVKPDHGSVGAEVVITGKYFGTKKGKVYIGEKSSKVVSWTMEPTTGKSTIHFLVPKGLPVGAHDLKVINKVGGGVDTFTVD